MNSNVLRLLVLAILVTLSACKKDRLKGDAEVLVGEWEWVESQSTVYGSGGAAWTTYYHPNENGLPEHSVEFLKRGKMKWYLNGELDEKGSIELNHIWEGPFPTLPNGRVMFDLDFHPTYSESLPFGAWLNSDSDDTLFCSGIPFKYFATTNNGGNSNEDIRYNKFVRVK